MPQLTTLAAPGAPPRLRLARGDDGTDQIVLRNESDADLPARFGGRAPDTTGGGIARGYALEIDAPGPLFWREALPGDFRRVTGCRFVDPGNASQPVVVAIPLATRLTFWFSHLPAHESLGTGLLQLAPNAEFTALRYRIADAPGPAGDWQPIQ